MGQEVAGRSGPDETKQNTEDMNRVNVFVNVAVQQSVVPDCVEDAIFKLSNVHAQVDSCVSDVVRFHVPVITLDETFARMPCSCSGPVTWPLMASRCTKLSELQLDSFVWVSLSDRRLRNASPMAVEAEKIKVVLCAGSSM